MLCTVPSPAACDTVVGLALVVGLAPVEEEDAGPGEALVPVGDVGPGEEEGAGPGVVEALATLFHPVDPLLVGLTRVMSTTRTERTPPAT